MRISYMLAHFGVLAVALVLGVILSLLDIFKPNEVYSDLMYFIFESTSLLALVVVH